MNPRYFYELLGHKTDLPSGKRSRGGRLKVSWCHIQVHLSGKLHPHGDAISEPYKPAFHGGHLSHNTSHGGAATFQVFYLP